MDVAADRRLREEVDRHPYPLLFATLSGAHLYGFASSDSDFDLRGVHVLPARDLLGLTQPEETVTLMCERPTMELDLVTHDARKFFRLLLKPNGYVLEQLYSPLVVHTTDGHAELKTLAAGCITRHHARHYRGFAHTQWQLLTGEAEPRVKPLLYVYRVLLSGIHLMRTGRIEADLRTLNEDYGSAEVRDLIALKAGGVEDQTLPAGAVEAHRPRFDALLLELEAAADRSPLPETPTARAALEDLLIRLRLPHP